LLFHVDSYRPAKAIKQKDCDKVNKQWPVIIGESFASGDELAEAGRDLLAHQADRIMV